MALSGICLRQDKGSTLTIQELDDNFRILTGSIEDFQDGTTPSCGACTVSILDSNANSVRYLTFVDGTSGFRRISTDSSTLTYVPCTNLLTVSKISATCVSGLFCGTASSAIDSNKIGGTPAACVIFNCGNQTVGGVKSFSDCLMINGGAFAAGNIVATTSNQRCLGNAACGFHTVFTGIVTAADDGGLGNLKLCGNKVYGDIICADSYFCGNLCGEAATTVLACQADTVYVAECTGNDDWYLAAVGGAADHFGIISNADPNFPTVNTSTNTVKAVNLCGTTSICGGNVVGASITTSGNASLGNEQSDTHQITGSLNISGSINSSDNIFPVVLQFGKSGAVYNTGGSFSGGYTEYFVDTAGGANTCNNQGYYFGYKGEIAKISLTGRFLAGCAKDEGIRAYPTINGVVQTSMYAEIPDDEIPDSIAGDASSQAGISFPSPKYLGAVIRVAGGDDGNLGTVCGTDYSVTLFVKTRSF